VSISDGSDSRALVDKYQFSILGRGVVGEGNHYGIRAIVVGATILLTSGT
jgi:hypothetical protein